jgi:hypothetical protein
VIKRIKQHRYSFNKSIKIFPKFYNCINKYSWSNFRIGILEHIDLSETNISTMNKNLLRKKFAESKDVRVWVFNKERKIVDVSPNAHKAAKFCNINHTALRRYLKSGKLWKYKYYFSREEKLIY